MLHLEKEARARGITGPICFATDGHKSRFFHPLLTWIREEDSDGNLLRDLYITPPNATGTLCWLDQLFQHLHREYGTHIQDLSKIYGLAMSINKYEAVSVVCELWNKWATPHAITRAMRVCGLKDGRWSVDNIPKENFMLSKKWEEDRIMAIEARDAEKPSWSYLSVSPTSPAVANVSMLLPSEGDDTTHTRHNTRRASTLR